MSEKSIINVTWRENILSIIDDMKLILDELIAEYERQRRLIDEQRLESRSVRNPEDYNFLGDDTHFKLL